LPALLHDTQAVGISQTLLRSAEGATYIQQAAITLGIGPHSSDKSIETDYSIKDSHKFVCSMF